MDSSDRITIAQLIRRARVARGLSQTRLAKELATLSGRHTINRDLISHWERGSQVPRAETRQWLSVFFEIPQEHLEQAASLSKRRARTGNAVVASNAPARPGPARRAQGTPELLPVFRSRVQAGILAAALLNPDRWFSLSELSETAGAALASVDKEAQLLEIAGIISSRTEGTMHLYHAAHLGPGLAPLVDLVRLSYGVPQVIGEEFGRVRGAGRLVLAGVWAERFAGVPGAAPESLELIVVPTPGLAVEEDDLRLAGRRAERRLRRPVRYRMLEAEADRTPRMPDGWEGKPIVEVRPVRSGEPDRGGGTAVPGRDAIVEGIESGYLSMTCGPDAHAAPALEPAGEHLAAAEQVAADAPQSALLLLAEAGELIAKGLLAQQGLRVDVAAHPNTAGDAITAQLGHQFSHVVQLRERSSALHVRASRWSSDEARFSTRAVRALLAEARSKAPQLPLFDPKA